MKRFFVLPLLVLLVSASSLFAQNAIKNVVVIAPSTKNYEAARDIITRSGWTETELRYADAVLVVINSDLKNPLSEHYQKYMSLKTEAETMPKVTSNHWHVYVYDILPDSTLTVRSHSVSVGSI